MPRRRGLHRLAGAIVLGEERRGALEARDARRELRPVLAGDPPGGGGRVELRGLDVAAAGNAVDVLRLLGVASRWPGTLGGLALPLGQLLLAFHGVLLLRASRSA